MFWFVGELYAFDGYDCIECFEQFHIKLAAGFISGCVFIEFWGCKVLSKHGSSYFCSVSYFLSFD